MSVTRRVRVAMLFAASQLAVWTGCNAILGNGYGAFDESAVGPGGPGGEGGPGDDALGGGEGGGPGSDGGPGTDADAGNDGNAPDGNNGDGGTCPRAICPTKLAPAVGPQRIALGTVAAIDYVYWGTATGAGRVRVDGTAANEVPFAAAEVIAAPYKRSVVVANGNPIVTVPARGAAVCTPDLTSCQTGFVGSAGTSSSVTADATHLYVGIGNSGAGFGTIYQTMDLGGTSPAAYMMTDPVFDLQVVGANTFYLTSGAIKRNTPTASGPTLVLTPSAAPLAFAVSGTGLIVGTASEIITCVLNVSNVCTGSSIVAIMLSGVTAVRFDGQSILWAEGGNGGSVHRCDFPSCTNAELLAEDQPGISDLAVDENFIYWANSGDSSGAGGAIMKIPRQP